MSSKITNRSTRPEFLDNLNTWLSHYPHTVVEMDIDPFCGVKWVELGEKLDENYIKEVNDGYYLNGTGMKQEIIDYRAVKATLTELMGKPTRIDPEWFDGEIYRRWRFELSDKRKEEITEKHQLLTKSTR